MFGDSMTNQVGAYVDLVYAALCDCTQVTGKIMLMEQ